MGLQYQVWVVHVHLLGVTLFVTKWRRLRICSWGIDTSSWQDFHLQFRLQAREVDLEAFKFYAPVISYSWSFPWAGPFLDCVVCILPPTRSFLLSHLDSNTMPGCEGCDTSNKTPWPAEGYLSAFRIKPTKETARLNYNTRQRTKLQTSAQRVYRSRRTHHKSRAGCRNCKSRRVKVLKHSDLPCTEQY
jgi:hypothetical protein